MKGTSGWSGDVTAPMQDAVEVSMGGGGRKGRGRGWDTTGERWLLVGREVGSRGERWLLVGREVGSRGEGWLLVRREVGSRGEGWGAAGASLM